MDHWAGALSGYCGTGGFGEDDRIGRYFTGFCLFCVVWCWFSPKEGKKEEVGLNVKGVARWKEHARDFLGGALANCYAILVDLQLYRRRELDLASPGRDPLQVCWI